YSLALSAQDANSGLHALNPSGGTNQGPEILLHRDSNGVIHGYPSGGKFDGTEDLFTITIDGKNNLVLDQIKPIWQDNTSSNNEQTILKAIPNTLKITATITDQDGDSASTSIDASSGIFAFQDSGPSISMGTGQQTTSTPSPNPQTPVNPGTITTQTTDIYDPHQNLGLILDYSGSMFDNGLKGEHAGWSRNAQHNLSRINQQLKATAETIEEALKNAGYEVQYSSGNQTNLDQWTVKTQQGHVPGNVHLGLAIFGSNVDTNDLIMRDITFNQNTKQVSYSALSQINTALHQASQGNTNHEAAWHAANSIVSDWLAINKSDPDSVTSGGVKHAINTDTNLLIMTDGETTRGQEIISKNSFIIADDHSTPNRGNGISYFNIKDQGNEAQALFRRVAGHINGWHNLSSSNDRNKAGIEIQLTDSAGIHRSIKVTAQEVYEAITSTHELGINTHGSEHRYSDSMPITYTDNNGIQHTVGWLGFPQMKDSSSQTVNPLVFTPNEAKGYTANSVLTSGDIIHDPQPAHATQLSQSQFSSNGASVASMLTDSLSKLDSMAGHQNSNVIGVGLVDSNNDALNSQLEGLFSGSLPQGSTYTKVTTDSTGPSVAQQIHNVVQQQFTDVNYKVEFTFNPGADDDASSGNVSPSGIVEFSLEKVGRLTTGGIHHFLETFGGISSGPNVKELPNGEYEITVQNLGIFTINTQSTLITTGSHVGTIEFKAFPGSKLTSDLQLEIGIKDADGDIKTVDFTIPKFDTTGSSSQTQHDEPDQNGFTADISVIANDALASAQADSDTEATLAALISLGLKTDHDDIDLSQSTQDDGSQLITRTIHTDQGDILETITDPQNGDAPSLQLDVSGLDADTQKDLQATIQAQTSSSDSESKPGQLDSVLSDATQCPPAIDGQSLADAIRDLQQLDADAIAALNGQDTSTNSADESSLSGDAAQTTRPQDPSEVPVTSTEDAFTSPQQTDDDVMAPPDLSDTSQTAAPLPDNSTQDQDLSLLNS
ncbi:hypothetical protein WB44_01990, partial [Synechococcus sp. WH 8020]|uniref:DUF5801 repeats-in-toxin domain-containing protein n=1 Tax=Synechococcus sp. (strain WH8020) TaxID=32052 RepID=UPI0006527824